MHIQISPGMGFNNKEQTIRIIQGYRGTGSFRRSSLLQYFSKLLLARFNSSGGSFIFLIAASMRAITVLISRFKVSMDIE
jgi:hypothetical protein